MTDASNFSVRGNFEILGQAHEAFERSFMRSSRYTVGFQLSRGCTIDVLNRTGQEYGMIGTTVEATSRLPGIKLGGDRRNACLPVRGALAHLYPPQVHRDCQEADQKVQHSHH